MRVFPAFGQEKRPGSPGTPVIVTVQTVALVRATVTLPRPTIAFRADWIVDARNVEGIGTVERTIALVSVHSITKAPPLVALPSVSVCCWGWVILTLAPGTPEVMIQLSGSLGSFEQVVKPPFASRLLAVTLASVVFWPEP